MSTTSGHGKKGTVPWRSFQTKEVEGDYGAGGGGVSERVKRIKERTYRSTAC